MDMKLRAILRDFIRWQGHNDLLKDPLTIDYELAETYLESTNEQLSLYDVGSSYDLRREIAKKKLECEENCIKEVIKQYTGKELTIEDAPKVQKAFHINDSSKYILAYDGVQLGMIRYINDGCNLSVEFTPNEFQF